MTKGRLTEVEEVNRRQPVWPGAGLHGRAVPVRHRKEGLPTRFQESLAFPQETRPAMLRCSSTSKAVITSNRSPSSARSPMSATRWERGPALGRSRWPASETSTPVTSHPRACAASPNRPTPQPTSSSLAPGECCTCSKNARYVGCWPSRAPSSSERPAPDRSRIPRFGTPGRNRRSVKRFGRKRSPHAEHRYIRYPPAPALGLRGGLNEDRGNASHS